MGVNVTVAGVAVAAVLLNCVVAVVIVPVEDTMLQVAAKALPPNVAPDSV